MTTTLTLMTLLGTALAFLPSAQASPFCQEKVECCEVNSGTVDAACWGMRWDDGSIGATEFCVLHAQIGRNSYQIGCVLGPPEDNCPIHYNGGDPCP